MNRRLVELVILEMDSQAFEDLVFSLVHAEEPAARQLKPPDAGRDTIVGANENHGELVWQVKHHTVRHERNKKHRTKHQKKGSVHS